MPASRSPTSMAPSGCLGVWVFRCVGVCVSGCLYVCLLLHVFLLASFCLVCVLECILVTSHVSPFMLVLYGSLCFVCVFECILVPLICLLYACLVWVIMLGMRHFVSEIP